MPEVKQIIKGFHFLRLTKSQKKAVIRLEVGKTIKFPFSSTYKKPKAGGQDDPDGPVNVSIFFDLQKAKSVPREQVDKNDADGFHFLRLTKSQKIGGVAFKTGEEVVSIFFDLQKAKSLRSIFAIRGSVVVSIFFDLQKAKSIFVEEVTSY